MVDNRLKSRKFWTLIGGVILLVGKALWPELADLETLQLTGLISAYLLGQGYVDGRKASVNNGS